jgi:phage terminase large subunit
MRTKLVLLALNYDGIQILLLRRTLGELRENHLFPLLKMLHGVAKYASVEREFRFPNGSRIKLGYCDNENDVLQYQGQAYEVIGMEEATHFTEKQFQTLTESNRISGNMEKILNPRMYFTCNPGGVGHDWVKRLFIDRNYRANENPEDYLFIKSLVFDNHFLMQNNPGYVDTLMALPEVRRKAMLYGDWNSFEGAFFPEFDYEKHTCEPFPLDNDCIKFRALDYGLDMTCCLWLAVTKNKGIICYRELYESGLIISEATKKILEATPKNEHIRYTTASPDLWNRRQETGKSGFEIMITHGLKGLQKANNARITGWRVLREYLKGYTLLDSKPRLVVFRSCHNLLRCLPLLRFDEYTKEDAADTPHEITHAPEALRYAIMSREPMLPKAAKPFTGSVYSFDSSNKQDCGYEEFIEY